MELTLLKDVGKTMEDIQKWLGHSTIVTTERIYANYDEKKKMKTLDKISGLFEDEYDGQEKKHGNGRRKRL